MEEEVDIRSLCTEDRVDLENHTKINRTIESLNEDEAYALTHFSKSQLSSLLVCWKLDDKIFRSCNKRRLKFTGEELLIVCLIHLASGQPWYKMIPRNFSGGADRWM
eukprot:6773117-Ditylum_brightwellii.AAC.1